MNEVTKKLHTTVLQSTNGMSEAQLAAYARSLRALKYEIHDTRAGTRAEQADIDLLEARIAEVATESEERFPTPPPPTEEEITAQLKAEGNHARVYNRARLQAIREAQEELDKVTIQFRVGGADSGFNQRAELVKAAQAELDKLKATPSYIELETQQKNKMVSEKEMLNQQLRHYDNFDPNYRNSVAGVTAIDRLKELEKGIDVELGEVEFSSVLNGGAAK
ncbi:MAG: hypothetical protein HRU21_10840 [Pseudomonadales bacterium]|nr:hypothetical protein [Pseudomonadales bacterium]